MSTSICPKCNDLLTLAIPTVAAGNKCLECLAYRYQPDAPFYLYLITNAQLDKHKIGIGSAGGQVSKLAQLLLAGYTVHGIWHHESKKKTYEWEGKVFKQIAAHLGESQAAPVLMGPWVRDWSEFIKASAISLVVIEKIISQVVKS